MALTSLGYRATVTLVDLQGDKSTLKYNFGSNVATFADATTAMSALLTALAAVTKAAIEGYALAEVFEDSAATGAGELSDVAIISARIAGTPVKWGTLKIPAPEETLFAEASGPLNKAVDPADADLVTYLSQFEATAPFTTSDGERLMDMSDPAHLKGWRITRGSR